MALNRFYWIYFKVTGHHLMLNLVRQRQTNKITNFEDYGGIFSIPVLGIRFLSLHLQVRKSLFLLIYLFFLMRTT